MCIRDSGVEVEGVELVQHGPVVVARQGQRLQCPQPFDALVGLWPVADQVAQEPDAVILPVGVGQHGLEGDEIGVNIGEEKGGHGSYQLVVGSCQYAVDSKQYTVFLSLIHI